MTDQSQTPVQFSVDDDDHAAQISAVLTAMGYGPERVPARPDFRQELLMRAGQIATKHAFTETETMILGAVLAGESSTSIGDAMSLSRQTVKWHMHCIYSKTNVSSREDLLRLAAGLPVRTPAEPRGMAN